MPQLKLGNIREVIPTFLKKTGACCKKKMKDNKHKSLHLERKYVPQNSQVSSSYARIPNSAEEAAWPSG